MSKQMKDIRLETGKVRIEDSFWSPYIRLVKEVVLPYQWEALNDGIEDAEPSHAIRNFRIAAGQEAGMFGGMVFQDSDVYKWLEAASYMLSVQPDPGLEAIADDVVELLAQAQQPDGYLNTYFTLKEPEHRWSNLAECHELYCAGHLIEAGVAYFQATGKRKLLDVCCRYADYVDSVFGSEPEKLQGYDGHQEIELALMKLYEVTGNEQYVKLSQFFLDERGRQPSFYAQEYEKRENKVHFKELNMAFDLKYSQSHLPVREQDTAVGHAVRLVYMCTGMAHVAGVTGDASLLEACRKLWANIVHKQMYITGAIGAMAYGESFTIDYDLPNDTVYGETCASIGLIFFARRMLENEPKGEYADVLERALYNTVLGGMAMDGKHFFYVNPLEVHPKANEVNPIYGHVKIQRQPWFGCSCCPPNIARLLASLNHYVYTARGDTLYVHLYIGGEAELRIDGQPVRIQQDSGYTSDGVVSLSIQDIGAAGPFTLAFRVPAWCEDVVYRLNGTIYLPDDVRDGYAYLTRAWQSGDRLELLFNMQVQLIQSHPLVRQNAGKVALQRGPFLYCLEEADNGSHLHLLEIDREAAFTVEYDPYLLDGLSTIRVEALRTEVPAEGAHLYAPHKAWAQSRVMSTFIPYYAWGNRGSGEMMVWVKAART
ncbi:beta-L-arabinofuranosidase domain-containing protein [Paenibacillus oryzisoli]|uniref:glycoside hydrolase family 127 protein n=1 Tax=Paenibacillus oryzisoli TaxID=1850517 RepID=UPI003D2DC8DE